MDNSNNLKDIWETLLKKMDSEIGIQATDLWIRPIKPIIIEKNVLKMELPDSIIYENVKTKFHGKLVSLLKTIIGEDIEINYSMSLEVPKKAENTYIPSFSVPKAKIISTFNPNYTFDSFIMGPSNRWARTTAEAVAKKPGTLYNPFFIYSRPGLGKTHLLHGIANEILENNPKAKIIYTPSENFVNEYITAIQHKKNSPDSFREKHRNLDCLLLDDIQFLTGKERSAEEFFYTFNNLFVSKKQIVVSSDRPPRELNLEERLVSRFLSGVIADIRYPEFETRIAILRQKNENDNLNLPEEIITYLAENLKKSIRELEGALLTIANYCLNMNIQPSIERIKEILKDHQIGDSEEIENISIDTIKKIVAEKYNIQMKDLKSQKRTGIIAYPRQIAMYLASILTDMSLPNIGDAFNKDHSTVVYAKKKIEQRTHDDPYFSALINQLITSIKNKEN